jgi:hypothetical protein
MKKIFNAAVFILFAAMVQAQNVGIGTTTPITKLNIIGNRSSMPSIPGATSTGVFRIGVSANEGIDFGKEFTPPYSAWMQIGFNGTPEPLSIQPLGGNVGIGILSPTAKLDVNGTVKIQGLNTLEFGAGVAKELNAGKIGYQTFTAGALDIIGAGTSVSNRKVNIFAEGGTTFNGPINVGGSTGTMGQVLTSNGTAAPTWANAALSNDVRFKASFGADSNSGLEPTITYSTTYNLNPTAVSISASFITINRSGLYHIEGYYETIHDFHIAPPSTLVISSYITIDGNTYPITLFEGTNRDLNYATFPVTYRYRKTIPFVREEYISAPATVYVGVGSSVILGSSTKGFFARYGEISGYLISD